MKPLGNRRSFRRLRAVVAALGLLAAGMAGAAGTPDTGAAGEPETGAPEARGSVTNLPLPRFVSLKASEANVRRGPSLEHRIDWVFRHRDMPLRVTAEFGHWRRVEDNEGQGGWIYYTLLSGVRTVLVETDGTALRAGPDVAAPVVAEAEMGVIGRLGECRQEWCRVSAGGERGWVAKAALWGVGAAEIRE